MIIQLEEKLSDKAKEYIQSNVESLGYKTTEVKTQKANYLVCIGKKEFDIRLIGSLDGVSDVHRVSDSYKLSTKNGAASSVIIVSGTPAFTRSCDVFLH